MYIYESHIGGYYASDEEYDYDELYCETCGDSDRLLGEFDENDPYAFWECLTGDEDDLVLEDLDPYLSTIDFMDFMEENFKFDHPTYVYSIMWDKSHKHVVADTRKAIPRCLCYKTGFADDLADMLTPTAYNAYYDEYDRKVGPKFVDRIKISNATYLIYESESLWDVNTESRVLDGLTWIRWEYVTERHEEDEKAIVEYIKKEAAAYGNEK